MSGYYKKDAYTITQTIEKAIADEGFHTITEKERELFADMRKPESEGAAYEYISQVEIEKEKDKFEDLHKKLLARLNPVQKQYLGSALEHLDTMVEHLLNSIRDKGHDPEHDKKAQEEKNFCAEYETLLLQAIPESNKQLKTDCTNFLDDYAEYCGFIASVESQEVDQTVDDELEAWEREEGFYNDNDNYNDDDENHEPEQELCGPDLTRFSQLLVVKMPPILQNEAGQILVEDALYKRYGLSEASEQGYHTMARHNHLFILGTEFAPKLDMDELRKTIDVISQELAEMPWVPAALGRVQPEPGRQKYVLATQPERASLIDALIHAEMDKERFSRRDVKETVMTYDGRALTPQEALLDNLSRDQIAEHIFVLSNDAVDAVLVDGIGVTSIPTQQRHRA